MHQCLIWCLFAILLVGNSAESRNLRERSYYEVKFFDWMKNHSITFDKAEEFLHRLNIFASNDDLITQHNEKAGNSFLLGHNEFSHLSWDEFRAHYKGYNSGGFNAAQLERNNVNTELFNVALSDLPESKDWVEDGAVTHVKNQGQCGSCWAFSTTGAVEGATYVHSHKLVELSEQELVDCDIDDMGCGGGLMDHAFKWIEKNRGICVEHEYPYHGVKGRCKKCKRAVKVEKFYDVPGSNETALQAAVAQQPVAVAIEADQPKFQFYKSGVFNESCGTKLDHGVLVVGYGEEEDQKYWKVKNSWGPTWGDHGFIKLAREIGRPDGQCGVAMVPSYAIAELISDDNEQEFDASLESSASINQCGDKAKSAVLFNQLTVSPSKPSRGRPIIFSGSGILRKPLADKKALFHLEVSLGGTKVFSTDGTMCGDSAVNLPLGLGKIDIHGFSCPQQPGAFKKIGVDVTLPEIAPPGLYEISLVSKHENDDVFCVHVELDLRLEGASNITSVYTPLQVA